MTAVGRPRSIARSYLYVPGDQPDKVARAASRGADACILDLEDAVAPANKATARATVSAFLADGRAAAPAAPQWWVRLNADTPAADIAAIAGPHLTGVVVPKADVDLLAEVHRLLGDAEREHGLPVGHVAVFALLETAGGVLRAEAVAAAPRVERLGLGEADLAAELCLQPGPDKVELWPLRSRAVLACAVARLAPPVGPTETVLRDPDRLEATSRLLLRQGFRGRTAIHPAQVPVVNRVFSPTTAEVEAAQDIIDRLGGAERNGSGVAVTADGRMIDAAVARSAREVLSRAVAGR
ncbi:HpcH/HpaI aldolase/citrate lyase family protein [Micromonospora sp. LH3U1]|uniref:HpcH/HpaI aldolase/citrate lyase family protein n=1 Tax=Micromonospora sp. LH3U1 TaxID=3018339 RepID=UPI00234B8B11|nr:CoA ester lyase [Micromonospora sp. LH3U1]WCN78672.1 CoA ester lyase [Micromonospora sp. LH3U1]